MDWFFWAFIAALVAIPLIVNKKYRDYDERKNH